MSNIFPPSDPRDESPLFTDTARNASSLGTGDACEPVIIPPADLDPLEDSSSGTSDGKADQAKQAAA